MIDPLHAPHDRAAIPLAPSLDQALANAHMESRLPLLSKRVLRVGLLAIGLGLVVGCVARLLTMLIGLVTNLTFHQVWSTALTSPEGHRLGAWVIVVPAIGGIAVGMMARWGSRAIRGHGIPEAMEQVLTNESRIPARMTWLKPLSSAIAIGTGGPFGAEGPIIATGGALGSFLGQRLPVSEHERKTLLAAGAAAGMAAIFSAPLSAVLLSIELLLFERRARSLLPVALAAATGTGVRFALEGPGPVFPMPALSAVAPQALVVYAVLGLLMGVAGVLITRLTYGIEDAFEKLPIHWMWWPALGGLVVGAVGYVMPATLGVGYDNITNVISGRLGLTAMLMLAVAKLVSWSVALGSGTSGGTLAPLFTVGGALGGACGVVLAMWPSLHVDPHMAALIGMAALFAGASRALMTSAVFVFETTMQPHALLPLLAACTTAYIVSGLMMRHTIMTEKIARRGVHVPTDFVADRDLHRPGAPGA
jgi:H+/Cl- antiporter ClcA